MVGNRVTSVASISSTTYDIAETIGVGGTWMKIFENQ